MVVVSNTTPLIGLAAIEQFNLLQQLFGEIYIPQAVFDEAVVCGREEGGAKREVTSASWIRTSLVKDKSKVTDLLTELDLGEAETIVLAQEMNADLVLMDEKKGRKLLALKNMTMIGTIGILLKAKQTRLIPTIRNDLMKLQKESFFISQTVFDAVLEEAGE